MTRHNHQAGNDHADPHPVGRPGRSVSAARQLNLLSGYGWKISALAEIRRLAETGEQFTSDDVLDAVGHPDTGHTPNGGNNLIGSVIREAKQRGLIEAIGFRPARQPHRKGGIVRIWRGIK